MTNLFCDNPQFEAMITDFLSKNVIGNEELIQQRYAGMRSEYKGDKDEKSEMIFENRGKISIPHALIPIQNEHFADLAKTLEDAKAETKKNGFIGLDLPTWFNFQSPKKGIVILVAQDPLRQEKMVTADGLLYEGNLATVSSPFGMHCPAYSNHGTYGKKVSLLIVNLVQGGYGVYLTDGYKFFVHDSQTSQIDYKKRNEHYKEILTEEIKAVESFHNLPAKIVPLGAAAATALREIGIEDNKILFGLPHPSERFGRGKKILFGEDTSHKTALDFAVRMYEIIVNAM